MASARKIKVTSYKVRKTQLGNGGYSYDVIIIASTGEKFLAELLTEDYPNAKTAAEDIGKSFVGKSINPFDYISAA